MKTFKNKQELIDWVEYVISVKLENDITLTFNKKRKILYTSIPKQSMRQVIRLLTEYKIRHEKHMNENYWIFIK